MYCFFGIIYSYISKFEKFVQFLLEIFGSKSSFAEKISGQSNQNI